MNKRCYKVIFSRTLHCLVVVSEWAKASGKSRDKLVTGVSANIKKVSYIMQRLSASILLGLGLATLSFPSSAVGISEDVRAPRNQQPMIVKAASGVTQVNIQTPTSAGVSMNQYSQFDVDNKGAVLANNRKATKARIAGWVDANPYLAKGEADVIVNQVNSNDPSQLNGYIEVAGKRADVIIANSGGITVNGGGFLNVNKTILSTGKTQLHNGKVTGHQIEKGKITINGKGLDVRDGNYTALLSRSAEINAGIYKGDGKLDVITGVNSVNSKGSITNSKSELGDAKHLGVAVDVSQLGGMYAGSIHLVGTEKGVGVNSAGQIQANVLTLSADGTLSNRGKILTESSKIDSKGLNNSGDINSGKLQVSTGAINNSGSIIQTGTQTLTITAQNLKNSGGVGISHSKDNQSDSTSNTSNKPSQKSKTFKDGVIKASGSINNTGTITAGGNVVLGLQDGLDNSGSIKVDTATLKDGILSNSGDIFVQNANLTGTELLNHNGSINLAKTDTFNFNQKIDNKGKITVADDIKWNTDKFNNAYTGTVYTNKTFTLNGKDSSNLGKIIADQGVEVDSTKITNQGSIETKNKLSITSDSLINKKEGKLTASQINVESSSIDNAGSISQLNNASLAVSTEHLNNSGNIGKVPTKEASKNSNQVTNNTAINSSDDGANSIIKAKQLSNTGDIVNNGKLDVTVSQKTKNTGNIITNTLTTNDIDNSGEINTDLANLSGNSFDNTGSILAETIRAFNYTEHINNDGNIVTKNDVKLKTEAFDNSGSLSSALSIVSEGNQWKNSGKVVAKNNISLTNNVTENKGKILSGKQLILDTKQLTNKQDAHIQANLLNITTENLDNSGDIAQTNNNKLTVKADKIENKKDGVLGKALPDNKPPVDNTSTQKNDKLADATLLTGTITVSNTLTNTGKLTGNNEVVLSSNSQLSNQGKINVTQFTHTSGTLDNHSGELVAEKVSAFGDVFNNEQGKLQAQTFENIDFSNSINNRGGKIIGHNDFVMKTADLDNTQLGEVLGANNLSVVTDSIKSDGRIESNKNLVITANKVLSNQGNINADKHLTITSTKVLNENESAKISAQTLQIKTDNLINDGEISQTGDALLAINAKNIANNEKASLGSAFTHSSTVEKRTTDSKTDGKKTEPSTESSYINVTDSIINNNIIAAGGKTSILATSKLDNTGTVKSSDLNVKGALSNKGTIVADNVTINVDQFDNQSEVSAQKFDVLKATNFINTGKVLGKDSYILNVKHIKNTGKNSQLASDNELTINSDTIDNEGAIVADNNTINVITSLENKGVIHAAKNIAITGKEASVTNSGNIQSASSSLTVQANSLQNKAGGRLFATQNATIDVAEKISNSGDILANNTLKLSSKSLQNSMPATLSGKNLVIKSDDILDNAGNVNAKSLSIITNELSNTGTIKQTGVGDLSIQAGSVENTAEATLGQYVEQKTTETTNNDNNTAIIPTDNIGNITVQGKLSNKNQLIGNGKVNLTSASDVTNQGEVNLTNFTLKSGVLDNHLGKIHTEQASLLGTDLNNQQGNFIANIFKAFTFSNHINNKGGEILGKENFIINTDGKFDNTNSGVISGEKGLSIIANALESDGKIVSGKQLSIDTTLGNENKVTNSGVMSADTTTKISTENLSNLGDKATITGSLLALTTDSLLNSGSISQTSNRDLEITSGNVKNTSNANLGVKISNKPLSSQSTSPAATGKIETPISSDKGFITVTNLLNNIKDIIAYGKTQLIAKNGLDNAGRIQTENLTQFQGELSNTGIIHTNNASLEGSILTNTAELTANKFHKLDFTALTNSGLLLGTKDYIINADTLKNIGSDSQISTAEKLTINSDSIDNEGSVVANTQAIKVSTELENKGSIYADKSVAINSDKQAVIKNSGVIQSGHSLEINAKNLSNKATLSAGSTVNIDIAKRLHNSGTINSQTLNITAESLGNTGNIQQTSTGSLNIESGKTVNKKDAVLGQAPKTNNNVTLDPSSKDTNTSVSPDSKIMVTGLLDNAGYITGNGKVSLKTKHGLQNQGKVTLDSFTLNSGILDNRSGKLNAQTINVDASTLLNNNGLLTAKKFIQLLFKDSIDNKAGTISGQESFTIKTDGKFDNTEAGKVFSGDNLIIKADTLGNAGKIFSTNKLSLAIKKALSNQKNISAQQLDIHSDSLVNQGIISQSSKGNIVIEAGNIINRKKGMLGAIVVPKNTSSKNKGGNTGSDDVSGVTADGSVIVNKLLDNSGSIVTSGSARITANTGIDNQGVIKASQLTSKQGKFTNTNKVFADTAILNSTTLTNSGEISVKTFKKVKAEQLINSGTVIGEESYKINADTLINKGSGSSLASLATLTSKVKTLTNEGLIEADKQTINVTDKLTNTGTINANKEISIDGGTTAIIQNKKLIQSKESGLTIKGQSLENSALTTIYAKGELGITTAQQIENAGAINGADKLTLNAESLVNHKDAAIQTQKTDIDVTKQVVNDGLISAQKTQKIETNKLINTGTFGATEEQNINVSQLDNRNVIKTGKLNITSDILKNSGDITQTGNRNLNISAAILENHKDIGHEKADSASSSKDQAGTTTPTAEAGRIIAGKLINKDTIDAGGRIDIKTTTALNNSGTLLVDDLNADGELFKNSKTLTANNITSKAKDIQQSGTLNTKIFDINGQNQTVVSNTGTTNAHSADWSNLVELKNTGKILVAKDLELGATLFSNLKDAIVKTQGKLGFSGQKVDNKGQLISQSQTFDISNRIDNKGIIASAQLQKIMGGAVLHNSSNAEIDAGQMDWKLSLLNNQGAIIHTGSDTLDINAKNVDNDKVIGRSPIALPNKAAKLANTSSSKGKVTIDKNTSIPTNSTISVSDTLSNTGFLVSNHNTTLTTNNELDNSGQIAVSTLTTQGNSLINSGTINADKLLSTSQQVQNTDKGEIVGDDLSFTGKKLINQGTIGAETQLTVKVSDVDNSSGELLSKKNLSVTAKELDNTSGKIHSVDKVIVDVTGGTLTNRSDGDIYGKDVSVDFSTLNNQDGRIAGHKTVTLTGTHSINNNDGGELIAGGELVKGSKLVVGGRLTINGGQTLNIDTSTGKIKGQDTIITAKSLVGDENVQARRDLGLHLQGSLNINSDKVVDGNLDITSAGNITNNATLSGGKTAHLQGSVINNAGTIISNNKTHIEGSKLTNEGLINSNGVTHLDVENELINQSTGRIYGDNVAIEADTLTNHKAENDAGVIGARKQLSIGVKHINNYGGDEKIIDSSSDKKVADKNPQDSLTNKWNKEKKTAKKPAKVKKTKQAQIVSQGSLFIGGDLDHNLNVQGQADTLVNKGGLIEAKGDADIAVKELKNLNNYFDKAVDLASKKTKNIVKYGEVGSSERLVEGIDGHFSEGKKHIYFDFYDPQKTDLKWRGGHAENVRWWDYNEITYREKVIANNPGKIIVGGDLHIDGNNWLNETSKIIVGGRLTGNTDNIIKNAEPKKGYETIEKEGTEGRYWYGATRAGKWRHRVRRNEHNKSFRPQPVITEYDFKEGISVTKDNVAQPNFEGTEVTTNQVLTAKAITVNNKGVSFKTLDKIDVLLPKSNLFIVDANDPDVLIKTDPDFVGHIGSVSSTNKVSISKNDTQSVKKEHIDDYGSESSKAKSVPVNKVKLKDTDKAIAGKITAITDKPLVVDDVNTASVSDDDIVLSAKEVNKSQATKINKTEINGNTKTIESIEPIKSGKVNLDDITVALQEKATARLKGIESSIDPVVTLQGDAPQVVTSVSANPQFNAPYVPAKLENNPALKPDMHKRIGDMYYEQRLIQDQITKLTGRRFALGYYNDLEQYKALINNGVEFAEQYDVKLGVKLSPSQMKRLTTDLVWLENQEITLTDGTKQTVTVPKVYLRSRNTDVNTAGSLISAKYIDLKSGDIGTQGAIVGFDGNKLRANNFDITGKVVGGSVNIDATNKVTINGGSVTAEDKLFVKGKTVDIKTATSSYGNGSELGSGTVIDRVAGLHLTGSDKADVVNAIVVQTENDINLKGAKITNNAQNKGITQLIAKNGSVNIDAVKTSRKEGFGKLTDKNHRRLSIEQEVGSHINSNTDVVIKAGDKVNIRQGEINSTAGHIGIRGEKGVEISEGRDKERIKGATYDKHKGFLSLSTTKTIRRYDNQNNVAISSNITGKTVAVQSGKDADINITGSNILSDDGTSVEAGGKVTIEAAKNYSRHNDFKQTKKSGFTASLSGGVASIGYGKSRSSLDQKGASTSLTGSIINSRNGNNTVIAGDDLNLIASKVSAGGDVSLRGKNVNLLTGAEENTLNMKAHSKSSGFSVGLTYSPAMAFVNAYNENRKSGSFSDSTVGKVMQQGTGLLKAGMAAATPVVVTAGHHKSSAYKNTNVSDGLSSEVNAGGKLTVVATEGSITSLGSSLSAGSDALLSAYKDITLGFARSSTNQTADNKKSGFSVDNRNWISPAGIYRDKGDGQGQLDSATGTVLSVGGKSTLQTQTGDIDIVGSSVVSEGDNIINAAGDVNIVSTQNSKSQSESHKSKGIGSAQISDTERFDGYMSGRSNASDQSVEQVRSLVGSEAGNVHIQAGGHYRQQVADVLADKDISVRAKSINILEDMNSGNSHQSSKDLKIGQFTKVSSPLIDLVNAVDEARKSKANDRVKSLQGLAVASRGYQAYDTVKNGGALVKVETGVGFKTAKSQQDSQYALSQSNKLNAGGNVSLTSTEGNIHLQNTNVNAGNLIALDSAKEILLESGQSHKKADGSNSSAGLSVGVGASVGAQTGVYVYGEAGWSQGENHLDSNTHRNTTLTSDKLSLTSKGNTTLRGATAKANRIDADIGGELTIESPQDVVKQSSEQTGVGARVQLSLGTAWEVSGNASHSEGKSNHQQVNEQSGLFAGDGGYHVTAENVDLKGGAIASTNAKNSELITNKITFSDVQNQSESSAVSASLSGKTGENENGQDITSVSPSLPMKNGNNDSSVTRATLTEGKITLNKDTNPTQTTAKALGINTELTNANVQTETPNDVGEMLKEQSTINSAIGDVSSAVNTYTQSKQKEVAEKLKTAKTPQEVAEIKAEVESWGVGGSNKRAVDTVTTLLTTALAGKSPTEVAAATASPYLNETIHKATEGNKTANLLAHAVLSAVEFKVAGLDPTVGALSGVAGEGTAMVLAEKVFNKPANQLTPKEKNILITASTLAGSLAGATGGSVEGANAGGVSAKTAVENNNLATTMAKRSYPVIRKVICSQKCQEAIIGLGIGSAIVLSSSEIEEAVSVAISQDPRKISNLTDLQRQYLNEQILNKKGIFIGNQQVWIPNTSGGFTPVDPELVVTTYGGKQIIDPRIFVDNTGGIQYPDDYEIPNNTAGDIDLNTLDVPNHTGGDQLVNKPDLPLALEKSNDEKYFTKPKTEEITGFENLVKARRKTLLQGGAGKRARWKDQDGNIYEWDSQHGALEKYNKRGKHLGEFDYKTGKQLKSADKKRRVEP